MESAVSGDASGNCLKNVAEVLGFGGIGALPPVFEHDGDPGLWSMSKEGTQNLSQTYAIESRTFISHTTAVLTQYGIDRMNTSADALMKAPGGGSSAIFGPDARKLSTDIPEAEAGIIYADLYIEDILKYKVFLDVGSHYSRPDILWLGVDDSEKKHSWTQQT
ncbi:uncharacterized protein EAF01_002630 [Botrytis porri]|uniref:uncharacterized protein n=1 Tax=Botrytis porri TaxID=87229 RepID=UPI0019009EA2|nr:uncharacterized protein EAF01_002630 [Botrytis porri]KAF7911122.1 hypothetical protein EAF01_002630 [Botrytis porri]